MNSIVTFFDLCRNVVIEACFSKEPRLNIDMAPGIDEAIRKWLLIREPIAIPDTQVKTVILAFS